MVTAQNQNIRRVQKNLKRVIFKNVKKLKYNFVAETVNLRISKCLNAKLLKYTQHHIIKKTHNILIYYLLLHNTIKHQIMVFTNKDWPHNHIIQKNIFNSYKTIFARIPPSILYNQSKMEIRFQVQAD